MSLVPYVGYLATALFVLVTLSSCASVSRTQSNDAGASARLLTREGGADRLASIDGRSVRGDSYELWPGRHRIEVTTSYAHCPGCSGWAGLVPAMPLIIGLPLAVAATALGRDTPGGEAFTLRSPPLVKCLVARPGHTYEVRTSYQLGTWQLEIFDHATTYDVSVPCREPL
jgi:hypothetical protein